MIANEQAQLNQTRRGRILIVDDEEDIRTSLKDLFETCMDNVEVVPCASGAEGLAVLRREPVDLIVSDYKMPGMNGLEFLAAARRTAPGVPRILATAFPDLAIADQARKESGIEHFLMKPYEPSQAVEAVSLLLRTRPT